MVNFYEIKFIGNLTEAITRQLSVVLLVVAILARLHWQTPDANKPAS